MINGHSPFYGSQNNPLAIAKKIVNGDFE